MAGERRSSGSQQDVSKDSLFILFCIISQFCLMTVRVERKGE